MEENKKTPYENAYSRIQDHSSKAVAAEVKRQRDKVGETKDGKTMGEYNEAPGGGTPAKGGGRGAMNKEFYVVNSKEEAKDIKKKDEDAVIRYNQPRKDDGTFTYNSANGKSLSTKTSRGSTPVPWLDGIDLTFLEKGSTFKYEYKENEEQPNEKDKVGRLISGITMTPDELMEAAKVLLNDKRGFAGIVGGMITKQGREAKYEKEAEFGKTGQRKAEEFGENTQKRLEEAEKAAKETQVKKPEPKPEPEPAPAPEPKPEKEPVITGSGNGSTKTSFEDLNDEQKSKIYNSVRETPGFENLSDRTISKMIQRGSIKLDDIVTPDKKKILEAMGL